MEVCNVLLFCEVHSFEKHPCVHLPKQDKSACEIYYKVVPVKCWGVQGFDSWHSHERCYNVVKVITVKVAVTAAYQVIIVTYNNVR